jgi:uncharacterized protein (DUF433 family)
MLPSENPALISGPGRKFVPHQVQAHRRRPGLVEEICGHRGGSPKSPTSKPLEELIRSILETMNGNTETVGYRYITRRLGVRGGHAIIEGTRVGVHDVISLLENGETVDSVITRCFPNITRAQVYECLAYYEDHRGEIDVLVARQMSAPTP